MPGEHLHDLLEDTHTGVDVLPFGSQLNFCEIGLNKTTIKHPPVQPEKGMNEGVGTCYQALIGTLFRMEKNNMRKESCLLKVYL